MGDYVNSLTSFPFWTNMPSWSQPLSDFYPIHPTSPITSKIRLKYTEEAHNNRLQMRNWTQPLPWSIRCRLFYGGSRPDFIHLACFDGDVLLLTFDGFNGWQNRLQRHFTSLSSPSRNGCIQVHKCHITEHGTAWNLAWWWNNMEKCRFQSCYIPMRTLKGSLCCILRVNRQIGRPFLCYWSMALLRAPIWCRISRRRWKENDHLRIVPYALAGHTRLWLSRKATSTYFICVCGSEKIYDWWVMEEWNKKSQRIIHGFGNASDKKMPPSFSCSCYNESNSWVASPSGHGRRGRTH